MLLTSGTRLGPDEITAPLRVGAMGVAVRYDSALLARQAR